MDIEEYVNKLPKFPQNPGLDNVIETLKSLNLSELPFKCIHIAGTKGKGSSASFIANILKCASFKTGLFISPHLIDIKERISINGENIGKEAFSYVFKKINKELSFFETLFIMALIYFRDMGVQIAVLETGLGGRLDATNVIEKPLVSILTTIGLDHLDRLGDTIEKIAYEKAGIIKANSPVISAPQKETVERIISERAKSLNSSVYFIGKDYNITREKSLNINEERFSFRSAITGNNYKELVLSLAGYHQIINASLAVATSEILNKEGYGISEEALRSGLINTKIRGRFEITEFNGRTLVLDGAHNPDSAEALRETLIEKFKGKYFIFVIAVLRNKLAREIILTLNEIAKLFVFTELTSNDTFTAEELKAFLNDLDSSKDAICIRDSTHALLYAVEKSKEDDIICITGSFYLVGKEIDFLDETKRNGGELWI